MKKMIMLAAAMVLAVGANAATVKWTASGMGDYVGNAYMFFIDGQKGASISAVETALTAGNDVSGMAWGSGVINSSGTANKLSGGGNIDGGKTYTSFMVLFDNADASKATSYVVLSGAEKQTQSPGSTAASVSFAAGDVSSTVAGTWSSISVPEPTSGLLLLVGGALMTLRRKQK